MATVKLSWFEMFEGASLGALRHIEALKLARPEVYGKPTHGDWEAHIVGVLAERAVAKHLGIYWEPVARRPEKLDGDVGEFQVRATMHENGRLILHDRDKDDARFYLVIAAPPVFNVVGSIQGRDGKRRLFWDDNVPRPAYFVPREALEPA